MRCSGWTADFQLFYNLPLHHYLSTARAAPDQYVLNITFGSPFPQAAIDVLTVRVLLPEGATDIQWSAPFDIDTEEYTRVTTYLDTIGRATLVLTKKNCVRHHNQNFQVSYRLPTYSMLTEPALLISTVFLLLMLVAMYLRTDLQIGSSGGDKAAVNAAATAAKTAQ